jgi:hypothetical protein
VLVDAAFCLAGERLGSALGQWGRLAGVGGDGNVITVPVNLTALASC